MLEISQVYDNIYVGSRPEDPTDYDYVANLGVQLVVDVTSGVGYDYSDNHGLWTGRGIQYFNVPIADMAAPNDSAMGVLVRDVFPLISLGMMTYIHCRRGKGRSPTVVMAYLMLEQGFTFDEAISRVQKSHDQTYITGDQYYFLKSLRGE